MRPISALVLFPLTIVIACTPVKENRDFDRDAVSREVEEVLTNYLQDISEEGLLAEFRYLDSSEDFFWVPPGYTSALSYDSVKTILEQNQAMFMEIEFKWETLQVIPLSAEISNYTGIVDSRMIDTAQVEYKTRMIESGTMILREDGWKILSGQSRNLPE